MASLLERSMRPQRGGLTAGVDYFGSVGKGRNAALNLNQGASTLASADSEVLPGTGMVKAPTETGFTDTRGSTSAPGDIGGGAMQDVSGPGMTPQEAQRVGLVSQGVALLGAATKDPALITAGRSGAAAAAASQGEFLPAAQLGLGLAGKGDIAGDLGLAAKGAGLAKAYYNDEMTGKQVAQDLGAFGVNTAINTNPAGAALNYGLRAATGLFGDTPISAGDIAMYAPKGYELFGNEGLVDVTQGGRTVSQSRYPDNVEATLRGATIPGDMGSYDRAALARSQVFNTAFAPGMDVNDAGQLISNTDQTRQQNLAYFGVGADTGSYGIPTPAPAPVSSGGGGGGGGGISTTYDTNPGSQQTAMLAAQEAGFDTYSGDTGGWNDSAFDGMTESQVAESGGGVGAADGGLATSNGFVRPMPGLTKRYMDGGPVQGGPMLAMGFAEGGMMGQMGGKPTPGMVNRQVEGLLRDPRTRQALLARPQQLMASGELTPDEVTTMGRVAEAAMFSPELYPQLRQFVAAQGMTPLPAAFDPSVILRIMAIARGLQQATPPGQVPSVGQAQMQRPDGGPGNGGYLQGPGTGRSDSIGTINETTGEPVKVANGEYVIPAHVVKAKGREFFDNLLRRYSDVPKGE